MKRAKKEHFTNLDINSISDNKKILADCKAKTTIKLAKNNKIIDDKIEVRILFNEYFINVVKKLNYLQKNKVKFPQKIA